MSSLLKIISNINCNIYIDRKFICLAYSKQFTPIPLKKGMYELKITSEDNSNVFLDEDYIMSDHDMEDIKRIEIQLDKSVTQSVVEINSRVISDDEIYYKIEHLETKRSIRLVYGVVRQFSEGLAAVHDFIPEKVEIQPGVYDYIPFWSGLGNWGYINHEGFEVIACQYANASCFKEGLAAVSTEMNLKYGYINYNGEFVIPQMFDTANDFKNGLAVVSLNNKYGLIDKSGLFVLDPHYDGLMIANEGFIWLKENEKWSLRGTFDRVNSLEDILDFVISNEFDDIEFHTDIIIKVKIGNKWGLVDDFGSEVLPVKYDEIKKTEDPLILKVSIFNCGYSFYNTHGYFLSSEGNKIHEFIKIDIVRFDLMIDNFIPFISNAKWGFVTIKGEIVVEAKYILIEKNSNSLFIIKISNYLNDYRLAIIENNILIVTHYDSFMGEIVKYPLLKYESGKYLQEGLSIINHMNNWGIIDSNYNELIPLHYEEIAGPVNSQISYFEDMGCQINKIQSRIVVKISGKWGVIDLNNNIIIKAIYDNIMNLWNGFFIVNIGGEFKDYLDHKTGEGEQFIVGGKSGIVDYYGRLLTNMSIYFFSRYSNDEDLYRLDYENYTGVLSFPDLYFYEREDDEVDFWSKYYTSRIPESFSIMKKE